MSLLKKLFFILLLGVVSVAGIHVAHERNLIPQDTLYGIPYQIAETTSKYLNPLLQEYQPAISHVQTVQQETGAVLGEFIQVNEKDSEKKLYERTLDQAQYLYCKQVVEQWEKETTQ